MRICIKCRKREGRWWDHLCEYCRKAPISETEALEYEKLNTTKDILSPEQIKLEVEQRYNKSAIVGFILSIISMFGIGLAGIAGFILGIVSLVQIKYTHQKGRGLAISAIIIGFIWFFVKGIVGGLIEAGF